MAANTHTTEHNLPEDTADEVHRLLREMANFTALYETIEEKLTFRETALEKQLVASRRFITEQLAHIKAVLADFQAIMTEAGAARWRIAAEKAFNEGKIHLETAQEISSEMIATLKQGSEQLEQAATKAITHLSEASSSFRTSQFKNAAANACDMIRNMASNQITKLAELIKWFHWKNLAMAIAVSLFITFLAGLYLNGEWPWDIHARVIKERNAGQMLLAAWPKLTPSEQQDIINGSKKAGGST